MNEQMFTYQTRLNLDKESEGILDFYSGLMNKVEHSLYADVSKGLSSASCKNNYLEKFSITARQFNSCRISLEGKLSACKASRELALGTLKQKIESLDSEIKRLEKKPSKKFLVHQKKRKFFRLSSRYQSLQQDKEEGKIPLCFGSKKLFRSQFHLEKTKFSTHKEWKEAWQSQRDSEFFLMGSKDETSGNQSCTATVEDDHFLFRLRLPQALDNGKYLLLKASFAYGHDAIMASLQECWNRKENKDNTLGQAISYRFKKDKKGWRLFVSTEAKRAPIISREDSGVIAVDINVDHIAYVETDRFGNPIKTETFPWAMYGKSKNQAKAITGDLCKEIIDLAKKAKKPIVIEDLNFQKKKAELGSYKKYSRMLSSFAYSLFILSLFFRAFKEGILIHKVNPAYTSLIGRCNYAKRYGLTIHLAAALCIARRYQKFSEKPCFSEGIPDGKGGLVTFCLPVRNRQKHVWHFWAQVKRKLTTVLAAHFWAIKFRSLSPSPDS